MAQTITYVSFDKLQKYDAKIKSYISDADAKSIKSVEIAGNTLKFYKEETPTVGTTPAFSIDLPETDISNLVAKIANATAGDVVIANADGTIDDGGVKLADLATKEEVKASETPIATSKVAGKVIPGGDFDVDIDGTINLIIKVMACELFW